MRPQSERGERPLGSQTTELSKARLAGISARSSWKRRTHFWLRWAHVYTSMFSLLAMLFFGLTGVTLNHPTWGVGEPTSEVVAGTLPASAGDGQAPELLIISEFVRQEHGVSGQVVDFTAPDDAGRGTITYRAPGSSADLFFDVNAGTYDLTINREGLIAMMNELHQGRDSGTAWSWIIDVAGVLLIVVGLTGLGIQFFLKKRRPSALGLTVAGAVVTVFFIWLAAAGGVI